MGLTSAKRLSAVTGTGEAKLGLGRPKGLKPASVALAPLPAAACRMLAKERRQQVCSLQADVRARIACIKRISQPASHCKVCKCLECEEIFKSGQWPPMSPHSSFGQPPLQPN